MKANSAVSGLKAIASSEQSFNSVNLYVAACTKLHTHQQGDTDFVTVPPPRTPQVKAILKAFKVCSDARKRDLYMDRGDRESASHTRRDAR
jgi:hypothetical protein